MNRRGMISTMPRKTVFRLILLLGFILLIQVMDASAGGWWRWPQHTHFYSHLADGFLHGQVSLPDRPDPRMLALPDPYDPIQNSAYRLHNAVLYKGKYFVYWGPTPALLAIPLSLAVGVTHPTFDDRWPAFLFMIAIMIVATAMMIQIQQRLFPDEKFAALAICILSLGLAGPVLFTLSRPAVYEAAIFGGQFFLLAGILAIWTGLLSDPHRARWMTLAGICLALSIGARVSLAPAIGVIVLFTLIRIRKPLPAIALLMPLLIAAALFASYNTARFGSITEFGLKYQLATANQHTMAKSDYMSPRFIAPNLLTYIFAAPDWLKSFPFVQIGTPRWAAHLYHLGIKYRVEPVAGLAWMQPLLILVLLALPWMQRDANTRWLLGSLWAAVILGFAPSLMIDGATMRYLMDMVPCCSILAAFGLWKLLTWTTKYPRLRNEIEKVVGFLLIAQCAIGLLLIVKG